MHIYRDTQLHTDTCTQTHTQIIPHTYTDTPVGREISSPTHAHSQIGERDPRARTPGISSHTQAHPQTGDRDLPSTLCTFYFSSIFHCTFVVLVWSTVPWRQMLLNLVYNLAGWGILRNMSCRIGRTVFMYPMRRVISNRKIQPNVATTIERRSRIICNMGRLCAQRYR